MNFLFGGRKTIDEELRANKRVIDRAIRELDQEKRRLEQEQTRITAELKKLAKQNQMDAVNILAKQFIRNKNYIKKFLLMRTNLQAVNIKLQTLKSTNAMSQAMRQVTGVMRRMNASMKLPQLQKIMMEFEKQSSLLESKEEMMNDAIDDTLEEDDAEETEAVVNKVLEELGIEMGGALAGLPSANADLGITSGPTRAMVAATEGGKGESGTKPGGAGSESHIDENDLEARLQRLKRG